MKRWQPRCNFTLWATLQHKEALEYYSDAGKYLGAWGSGAFAGFRALRESEYQDVLAFQKKVQDRINETADPNEDPGWSKPLTGPIGQAMFEASRPIVVQANEDTLINKLFNDAKAAHGEEQGAFHGVFLLVRNSQLDPCDKRRSSGRKEDAIRLELRQRCVRKGCYGNRQYPGCYRDDSHALGQYAEPRGAGVVARCGPSVRAYDEIRGVRA